MADSISQCIFLPLPLDTEQLFVLPDERSLDGPRPNVGDRNCDRSPIGAPPVGSGSEPLDDVRSGAHHVAIQDPHDLCLMYIGISPGTIFWKEARLCSLHSYNGAVSRIPLHDHQADVE